MKGALKKKLWGTALYGALLTAIIVGIGSPALARFMQFGSFVNVDGQVSAVTASTLTVITSGATPITFAIGSHTIFPSGTDLSDIMVGDIVSISSGARGSANPLARVVRERTGSGYGFTGEQIVVQRAVVIAKTPASFTVEATASDITFQVTIGTQFIGVSFASLQVGDQLLYISGRDSGTSFEATTVFVR